MMMGLHGRRRSARLRGQPAFIWDDLCRAGWRLASCYEALCVQTSSNPAWAQLIQLIPIVTRATGNSLLNGLLFSCTLAAAACSSSTARSSGSGNCVDTGAAAMAQGADAGSLKSFRAPSDPGAQGMWFTASGEVLALGGYSFPPASADSVVFVDGWELHFDRILVTLDNITLSENPDLNPGDQSQTGSVVARIKGPWAIDLHQGGPLQGKGGSDEQATPIVALWGQNANGCAAFDLTQRYAFNFDAVPATANAMNVNLDANAQADYANMIAEQYTVLYVGTASWNAAGADCKPASPEFARLPTTVDFQLGFKSPTRYGNCQNPDNDPAEPLSHNEEHQRGIYAFANKASIAQLTIHTDHPFWDSLVHDSPMHFDQIAARYTGVKGTPKARVEDFAGVDYTYFTDTDGNALPWRNCRGLLYTPPDNFTMHFDPQGHSLVDYQTFMVYNQSTQGHLNSDGLCWIDRHYPSPY